MKTKLNHLLNLRKALWILAIAGTQSTVFAQDEQPKVKFGVNADGYYKLDAGRLNSNSKTRFTPAHNSFELGMISVDATYKKDKMTAFVDLGAGSRIDQYNNNSRNLFTDPTVTKPGSDLFLKQAYISYEVTSDLSITAGSWKKHIGYEQINAVDNGNYSMSYGFSNTNFFNTGVKLDYKLDKFNFMIGVVNPADFRTSINSGSTKKNYIGQFGYNRENTKFIYGVQTFGIASFPGNVVQNDLIVEHKFDDKLTLAVNITNTNYWNNLNKSWNSAAVYVKYAVQENLKLNYRGEFFNSDVQLYNKLYKPYRASNIFSNTISANYIVGGFTIIPEIRIDASSKEIFMLNDKASKMNAFFVLGTTYKF